MIALYQLLSNEMRRWNEKLFSVVLIRRGLTSKRWDEKLFSVVVIGPGLTFRQFYIV